MTKFNHALDVQYFPNISNRDQCEKLGHQITSDLKSFNTDVETKILCYEGTK